MENASPEPVVIEDLVYFGEDRGRGGAAFSTLGTSYEAPERSAVVV